MAYNYNEQTNTSNFLIPFTIANDCPQENREIIYRIIINLKNNFFKETKHIQQINIHRNHLVHYLPVILLDRDQYNKHYTFTLTDEKGNKKIFFNFQNETSLSDMFKIFLKRHEESQDKTKLTAVTSTTYETLKNTGGYLNEHRQQIQSVNDKLRSDIKNYNNWLTNIIELKTDLKTTTLDIIKIVSEFTFLFWLDNFEHINEKRVQFGETFPEEINHLCEELQNIWNSEYYSEQFESTLKICSDSINFIEGLQSHVKITDQSQTGSSSFNLSRSLTSTSTPKDIQTNNSFQIKQKSTLKPDKQLTSNLFGNQQNIDENIDISDSEEREIRFENQLSPSVKQNARRKYPMRDNRNNIHISSLNDNQEYHEQYWRQQTNNYMELKNEITATATNHTNKLIDDLEMKYQQMNKRMEKRQEEALEMVFDRLDKNLDNINSINRQTNLRTENEQLFTNRNIDNIANENIQNNNRQYNRQQENRNRRTNSITTEERETTVVEPPLPFYKQLISMSINEEPQIEQSISSGSVPTTIRPFDGTDPAYTVEEYLNSIVAAMIFSSGIEPVKKNLIIINGK